MGFAEDLNSRNQYAMPAEIDWIRNHAGEFHDPKQCVMLGAGPGVFAVALKEGSPDSWLSIVDINTTYYAVTHLLSYGLGDRVNSIISDSAEAGDKWDGPYVNFLIVDAAHDQQSVEKDIDAWFPNVPEGGYIFFHDFLEREGGFNGTTEWKKSGVAAAIASRIDDRWEFVCDVGISRVYRKIAE